MEEKKHREFWIIDKVLGDGKTLVENTYLGSSDKPSEESFKKWPDSIIHVIEFSAYETALAEIERLKAIVVHHAEANGNYFLQLERLKSSAQVLVDALEYYRGSDDDETSWQEPDQYVPYWTLWNNGDCVNGDAAKKALEKFKEMGMG